MKLETSQRTKYIINVENIYESNPQNLIQQARKISKTNLTAKGVLTQNNPNSVIKLFTKSPSINELTQLANIITVATIVARDKFIETEHAHTPPSKQHLIGALLKINIPFETARDIINICIHEDNREKSFYFSSKYNAIFTKSANCLLENIIEQMDTGFNISNQKYIPTEESTNSIGILNYYNNITNKPKILDMLFLQLNAPLNLVEYYSFNDNDDTNMKTIYKNISEEFNDVLTKIESDQLKLSQTDLGKLARAIYAKSAKEDLKQVDITQIASCAQISLPLNNMRIKEATEFVKGAEITKINDLVEFAKQLNLSKTNDILEFITYLQLNDERNIIEFVTRFKLNDINDIIKFVNTIQIKNPDNLINLAFNNIFRAKDIGDFFSQIKITGSKFLAKCARKFNEHNNYYENIAEFIRQTQVDNWENWIQEMEFNPEDAVKLNQAIRKQQITLVKKTITSDNQKLYPELLNIPIIKNNIQPPVIVSGDIFGSHSMLILRAIQAGKIALSDSALTELSEIIDNEITLLHELDKRTNSYIKLYEYQKNVNLQQKFAAIVNQIIYLQSNITLVMSNIVDNRLSLDKIVELKLRETLSLRSDHIIYISDDHDQNVKNFIEKIEIYQKYDMNYIKQQLSLRESNMPYYIERGIFAQKGMLTNEQLANHRTYFFCNAFYHEKSKTLYIGGGISVNSEKKCIDTVYGAIDTNSPEKFVNLVNELTLNNTLNKNPYINFKHSSNTDIPEWLQDVTVIYIDYRSKDNVEQDTETNKKRKLNEIILKSRKMIEDKKHLNISAVQIGQSDID